MKKLMMIVALLGFTVNVQAECAGELCHDVMVTSIMTLGSGTILIGTSGDESKLECKALGDKYLTVHYNIGSPSVHAALLHAQTTKKIVSLRLRSTLHECALAYVLTKS